MEAKKLENNQTDALFDESGNLAGEPIIELNNNVDVDNQFKECIIIQNEIDELNETITFYKNEVAKKQKVLDFRLSIIQNYGLYVGKSVPSPYGSLKVTTYKEKLFYPDKKILIAWAKESKYNNLIGKTETETFKKKEFPEQFKGKSKDKKGAGDCPEGFDIKKNHVVATVKLF